MRQAVAGRDMTLFPSNVQQLVTPFRLIFIGVLLCVFNEPFDPIVTIGTRSYAWQSPTIFGIGFTFDILNDFVGTGLIAWSVFWLAKVEVHSRYRITMIFAQIIAVLSCVDALHGHLVYDVPPTIEFILVGLDVAIYTALTGFCVAMRWLSLSADLARSARNWKVTTLWLGFTAVVLLLLNAASTIGGFCWTPAPLVSQLLIIVALILFLYSAWRMGAEIKRASLQGSEPTTEDPN